DGGGLRGGGARRLGPFDRRGGAVGGRRDGRDVVREGEHDRRAVPLGEVEGVVGGGRGAVGVDLDDGDVEAGGERLLVEVPPPRAGARPLAREEDKRDAGQARLRERREGVGEAGAVGR